MLIIGELINSTRKKIRAFIEEKNAEAIKDIALKQVNAGAHYLDVNSGAFVETEPQEMEWLVKTIRSVTDIPLCIDSPRPEALKVGLELAGKNTFINSITGEKERYGKVVPLIKEYNASVVALSMDDRGILNDAEQIIEVVDKLRAQLEADKVPLDKVYFDPLVKPLSVDSSFATLSYSVLKRMKEKYPDIKSVCGLSNVSFGLPNRRLINQTFMVMMMTAGLDAVIADPLDRQLMADIIAAEALLGKDEFCMNYIAASRAGKFGGLAPTG